MLFSCHTQEKCTKHGENKGLYKGNQQLQNRHKNGEQYGDK